MTATTASPRIASRTGRRFGEPGATSGRGGTSGVPIGLPPCGSMLRMVGWTVGVRQWSSRPARGRASAHPVEELARALHHQRGRVRVVRREGAVGEQVSVARVHEQLGELGSDRLDQLAGEIEVAALPEERVLLHAVDLHRDTVRPRSEGPLAGDREAALVEQRSARTRLGSGRVAALRRPRRRSRRTPGRRAGRPRPASARALSTSSPIFPVSAMPSSMLSGRAPSKRSGVCTVCPPARSSSANARTPSVSPCTWWNRTTSATSTLLPIGRLPSNDPGV